MTMRRALPHAVALLLGAGAAVLIACGGSTKGGIPAASAGELKSQIEDVLQAVDGGRCDELDGQLRQVDEGIEALPATVDQRLRQSLADAGEWLLNPGSVGQPRDGDPRAAWLLLDLDGWRASWRRVEYDIAGAAAAIRAARLPDSLAERLGYGQ